MFPCKESMEVSGVNTLNYLRNPQSGFESNALNTTVIVQATVTDPFGGYDVRWANVTITGPSGIVLNNATMEKVGARRSRSPTPTSGAGTTPARRRAATT
jgi:hypothetical protein